jgi:2-(1,2-epoxy-1,2-dihydrophenyl)acetyl-CoA isomerase
MQIFDTIQYLAQDGLATITLHRPEVYHALNVTLLTEITQAVKLAEADETVRVVVLTGSGSKAFCSGADLKNTESLPKSLGARLEESYHPMVHALRDIPKPVICRLNGVAAGAGFSLALACDMIIAQQDAYVSLLFVGIGLMPDAGANFFMPRLVGSQKAFELATTGRKVFMEEALALGIVNKVVPIEALDAAVDEMVQYYKNAPTTAIAYIKKLMNGSFNSSLGKVLSAEANHQDLLGKTEDFKEGVTAFLEKRPAVFKGK